MLRSILAGKSKESQTLYCVQNMVYNKSYILGTSRLTDRITISGSDGDDAQRYQEAEVQNVLRKLRKVQDE